MLYAIIIPHIILLYVLQSQIKDKTFILVS